MIYNNADLIHYDNRESGLEGGNVQTAIDELVVRGLKVIKLAKSGEVYSSDYMYTIDYPTGFNKDNTYAIGVMYTADTGSKKLLEAQGYHLNLNATNITLQLATKYNGSASKPVYVLIGKADVI